MTEDEPQLLAPNEQPDDGQLLRPAMFHDGGDPALTWWLPLPGLAVAAVWAAYQGATADGDAAGALLSSLLWPGAALFAGTTVTAYLGWRLDID